MYSALFYLQFQSLKNRLLTRIKRLKQPKYLAGAIVGGLYFYWYFFRVMFRPYGRHGTAGMGDFGASENLVLLESVGALILLVIVALAWIIPHKRAALTFTESEIAFLFPAPVSRRTLIHFKLMKSQLGLLFTTFFMALIFRRSGGHFWIRMASWWVIFTTLRLHLLGSSFALTMLMDRGIANWKRRLGVATLLSAIFLATVTWAWLALPKMTDSDVQSLDSLLHYARAALESGPLPYLLYPFRIVVKPYLADDAMSFLMALWPALLLMAAHYWWVVRSDVAFEEASIEASQKLAEKVAAVRSGNWRAANKKLKKKRDPFNLRPSGFPLIALFWKNLIGTGQYFTARVWIYIALIVFVLSLSLRGASSSWALMVGMIAGGLCLWSLLIGPQVVRHDLRQDLQNADLLKVYPMHGWQVVLGEILAPAAIITGMQMLLLIVATACLSQSGFEKIPPGLIVAAGLGALIVIPAFNCISLLIPNAAVLLFPSWFQSSREGMHGIEATGQRLIFAIGQFLVMIVTLLPAALVFTGIFFLIKHFAGMTVAVPLGAVMAAAVLMIEAGLGIVWLGWLFERFDVSSEQTP